MKPKVLVTGAGLLLGQGIIRSLQNSSLSPTIIAADPVAHSAGLYWGERGYLTPFASDPGYLARIEEILALEKPDALLLGSDAELAKMASARAELEEKHGTRIVVSSPEAVKIADDKYLTYQFLREHDFDYPDSCLPGEEGALIARTGFPMVVKPRIGARSVGMSVVRDREELARAIAGRPDVVIQECVGDKENEYTASALVFDGECRATIVMRRELRDGNTYRAFVEPYPGLNAMVRRLGVAFNPYGPANFQFRLDAQGRVKVFEINARFSGTTPLRALAGFNEVEMCLRHVLYGEPIAQPPVEEMAICRHWSDTVVRPEQVRQLR
ncbi:MAG TPA: ATP-grasp domain-containing protein [Rhizomicrobium sp.]|nr:ATP-grasp domain-containing protein [Rhizomicrobium sp.]